MSFYRNLHSCFKDEVLIHQNSHHIILKQDDNDNQPILFVKIGPDSDTHHYDFLENCNTQAIKRHNAKVIFWKPEEAHIIIINNKIEQFKAIHEFIDEYNIAADDVHFVTGNFRIREAYDEWSKDTSCDEKIQLHTYELFSNTVINDDIPEIYDGTRKSKYICLNRVSHPYRAKLLTHLHNKNLMNDGLISFHNMYSDSYSDSLLPKGYKFPLIVDSDDINEIDIHSRDNRYLFKQSYFSLIPESVFDRHFDRWPWWREGFLTEKTFKVIYNLQPFIIVGAPGSLRRLQEIGFKTFDGFIDESYDEIYDDEKRMEAIITEMKRLCSIDLKNWYHDQIDILKFNQSQLIMDSSRINLLYHSILNKYQL